MSIRKAAIQLGIKAGTLSDRLKQQSEGQACWRRLNFDQGLE
jgi:hypothetical protein